MEIRRVTREPVEAKQVIIRAAVIITAKSVRLQVISKDDYEKNKGNGQGRWFDYPDTGGREAFKLAGLMNAKKKFAIPASMLAGSEVIVRLTIDWEKRFRHREKLLACWVMNA